MVVWSFVVATLLLLSFQTENENEQETVKLSVVWDYIYYTITIIRRSPNIKCLNSRFITVAARVTIKALWPCSSVLWWVKGVNIDHMAHWVLWLYLRFLMYFPFVQVPSPLTTRSSFNLVGAQGIVNVLLHKRRSDDSRATSKGKSKKRRQ